jgi:superfamily II DNA or RNA helicase
MGSGKTYVIAGLLKKSPSKGPTLIVTSTNTFTHWRDTIRVVLKRLPIILLCTSTCLPRLEDDDIVLLSHNTFRMSIAISVSGATLLADVLKTTWYRVIVDEAQRVLSPDTIKMENLSKIKSTARWAISGETDVGDRHKNFGPVCSWSGGPVVTSRDKKKLKVVDLDTVYVYLDFDNEIETLLYDAVNASTLLGKQKKLRIRQICADVNTFIASVQVASTSHDTSSCTDACIDILRVVEVELVVGTKIRYIAEVLIPDSDDDVFVIFCKFKREAYNMSRYLVDKACISGVHVVTGDMSASNQSDVIDRFGLSDNDKVLILTVGVGVAGLNLQAANHVVMTSGENVFTQAQALARVLRKGQERKVRFTRLKIRGKEQ